MESIFLLRHAKAESLPAGVDDFDRQLTERGRRDSAAVGEYLKRGLVSIDLAICSPAARARETLECVLGAYEKSISVLFDERIYEATSADLRAVIDEHLGPHLTVMLVGHNPGLEHLVEVMTGQRIGLGTANLAELTLSQVDQQKSFSLEQIFSPG